MDRGAWQATVQRVSQSQTQLKRLGKHGQHVNEEFPQEKSPSEGNTMKEAFLTESQAGRLAPHQHGGRCPPTPDTRNFPFLNN